MTKNITKLVPKDKLCAVCGKNKAERRCDYVVGYNAYTFDLHLSLQERYETCDVGLCRQCASSSGSYDLCPYHTTLVRMVDKGLTQRELESRNQYKIGLVERSFHRKR